MDFHGKAALITGASRGIGLATAVNLARGGAALALIDLNEEGLHAAKTQLEALGVRVLTWPCDVSDEARVQAVCADAEEKLGRIDILVNNAGIYRAHCVPFAESESAFWRDKIEVNILGTMYFTRALLPGMLRRHYGRIINLASVAGVYGIANMTDYSMTKGAIIGFTHALAKEVTSQGVLVNAVSPGSIDDDPACMPIHSFMGRAGSFAECAEVICFLASDAASYVAGQNYLVDGCRRKM